MNQIDHLVKILEIVKISGPDETAEYFDNFLQSYLVENESLEVALDLKSTPGKRKLRTRYLMAIRNSSLREAHALCDPEGKTWLQTLQLQKEVRNFETILWPRWRDMDIPPPGSSGLRSALFSAFKTGLSVPESDRQLHLIVTGW